MAERFVVDNSVVMAWCFQDESSPYADSVLEKLTAATVLVPAVWILEVVNVLLAAERKNRLCESDSSRFLNLLALLPIEVSRESPELRMEELLYLGRSCGLSSYDAAYLNLAIREGLPIATQDEKLRNAAQKLSVPVLH